ncbi:hypothetical protein [Luteolibacter marinus]|uniref:hypothetical protein n=1 Tax=Luteolibacter marinus TaxID=2776705 RepID=UPI001D019817|nr:hypothetical protein [Luteolibacter marinus]
MDECPWWLRLSLHYPFALQERAKVASRREFLNQPSAAQIRLQKDRAKMLRSWMPNTPATALLTTQVRRCPRNVDFLLTVPTRGWLKQTRSEFGNDRLLLLDGNKDYDRLLKHREVPPYLLEMESGGNAWPRVTLHGWLKHDAVIRTVRKLDDEAVGRLGWLVPVGSGKVQEEGDPDRVPVIDNLFQKMSALRLGKSFCFSPPPEIASRIETATSDLRTLLTSQPMHLHTLGLHEDQLVWQIAALLAFIARGNQDEDLHPHHLHEVVDAAAAVAGRIAASHLNLLRQALPVGRGLNPLARQIVDRLAKGPATPRELVRSFHRIRTDEVEQFLHRLAQNGLVARIDQCRWSLVRVPLPDLSAIMSESIVES